MDNASKPSWIPKLGVLLAVVAAGGAVAFFQSKTASEASVVSPEGSGVTVSAVKTSLGNSGVTVTEVKTSMSGSGAIVTEVVAEEAYKDGVYSTTGDYASPAGPETIDVTLTIAGGIVTEATVVANAVNPVSQKMQGQFVEGYKEFVVGKSLADLELAKVSGSSLTPKGFNEALAEIRVQAAI